MKREDNVSKVTKVLIKDLKGRRVAHHNFHEQNKKKFGNEEKETKKIAKQQWWATPHGAWTVAIGAIMICLLMITIFAWQVIFKGEKRKIIAQQNTPKSSPPQTAPPPSYPKHKTTITRYTGTKTKSQPRPKKKKTYSSSEIVSFPAPKKKSPYNPPKIISYTVHLRNGTKMYCKTISKTESGKIKLTTGNRESLIALKDVTAIQERTTIGKKRSFKFIKPDSI